MAEFDDLFKNKYRINSIRLPEYNYSNPGHYCITICTKNRIEYFGKIRDGKMYLNKYGIIARQNWLDIVNYFDNIALDEFIIMPNHIHGIIEIQYDDNDNNINNVETIHESSLQGNHRLLCRRKMLIPIVIGKFKMITSKQIHNAGYRNFAWQTGYYDHVIRNGESLNNVREYIRLNPLRWESDRKNPENF